MIEQRLHALISGRVTGVGFRYFVLQAARRLGLLGFVRNLPRQVEVVAEGEREQLEELTRRVHEGPSAARVDEVQISYNAATGEFRKFDVRASSH